MDAGSISNLFQGQLDYVFFFQGLAFFLISVCASFFEARHNQRLPWLWFGIIRFDPGSGGLDQLLAISLGAADHAARYWPAGLKLVSLICLTEFGRAGFSRTRGQDGGWWLLTLLLMITGLGGLKAGRGFKWRAATPSGWWGACGPSRP